MEANSEPKESRRNSNYKVNPVLYKQAKEKFNIMSVQQKNALVNSMSWFFIPDNNKKKTREQIQAFMKKMDRISLFLAAVGIVTNIIASSLYISFEKKANEFNPSNLDINLIPNTGNDVQIFRAITSVTTLILLGFIVIHYKTRLNFLKFKQRVEHTATLVSTNLIWGLIFEFLICLIHSPPKLLDEVMVTIMTTGSNPEAIKVELDLIICCIVPLRVYLLFRYYAFYSSWADDRAEKICNECNATGGVAFAVKAELKERPYKAIGVLMVLSILIFGYALRNIEAAFMKNVDPKKFQDWRYIWNGWWCIVITILTVGYGDYYPQTHFGRAIAVVACLWGTFLISLMVVSLTNSVDFTPQEEKAYDEIKKDDMYFTLRSKALNMIRDLHTLKNYLENAEEDSSFRETKDHEIFFRLRLMKYKKSLHDFRVFRKNVINKENENSTETILNRLNQSVSEDMEELINISNHHVFNLIEHVKLSKNFQEQIRLSVGKLENMTKGLHDCITKEEPKILDTRLE
jgi:hypothetical protein